jgi:hypothetical protein
MNGGVTTTIVNPVCNPHDVEYYNGKIYWFSDDELKKADADGSNVTTIMSPVKADGLAIDATYNRIYWADYIYNYIRCVNIDGTDEQIISTGHHILSMIDTDYNPAVVNVENEANSDFTFELYQNYPNPFNPSTVISYQLPVSSDVTLRVYDILGSEITTLVDEYKPVGMHNVEFTINNLQLSSGVYFCRLKTENYSKTIKMLYLK